MTGTWLFDILFDMKTNVSGLLRDFPRVRRAALAGEQVLVETREGNLIIAAEHPPTQGLYGSMRDQILASADDLDRPTLDEGDRSPSL